VGAKQRFTPLLLETGVFFVVLVPCFLVVGVVGVPATSTRATVLQVGVLVASEIINNCYQYFLNNKYIILYSMDQKQQMLTWCVRENSDVGRSHRHLRIGGTSRVFPCLVLS